MNKYYVDVENISTAWTKIFGEMESYDVMFIGSSL